MQKIKAKFNSIKDNQVLLLIMAIASYLRLTGLLRRDFWYDEAFTGIAVKENFSDMINMIVHDVHPPLYYILLKFFAFFFNYSVFGIRLFSAIFGILTVFAVYIFAKELFNRKAALWASLVAAISPFAIQYSQEARMYSMLVFLVLMAAYFFVKGLNSGKTKYFVFWGIFTGLSMLTHYMGLIFSVTYYFVYIIWLYFQENAFLKEKFKGKMSFIFKKILFAKNILVGYLTAVIIFSPWIINFIRHLTMKGNNLSWVKPASLGDLIVTVQMFLFGTPLGEMSSGMPQPNEVGLIVEGTKYIVSHVSIRAVLAMLLGVAITLLYQKEKKEKLSMLLCFSFGFMGIIYLLSLFFEEQQYFVARYLLPGAYFIFVFIGVALSRLKKVYVVGLLGIYLIMLSAIIPLSNSTGYNEMIKHLAKYKNKDFYILNSFDYVITKYYLGSERLTLYNYDWPQYNPDYWAAIGPKLKRTENFDDLKNDPNAIIISNKRLDRDNQYFETEDLQLIDQYNNILLYKFKDAK
jgi:uncharacterized membrane protein